MFVFAILVGVGASTTAPELSALLSGASRARELGDWESAERLLAQAYQIKAAPEILYNRARAAEAMGPAAPSFSLVPGDRRRPDDCARDPGSRDGTRQPTLEAAWFRVAETGAGIMAAGRPGRERWVDPDLRSRGWRGNDIPNPNVVEQG
jgi:hypothetical protein